MKKVKQILIVGAGCYLSSIHKTTKDDKPTVVTPPTGSIDECIKKEIEISKLTYLPFTQLKDGKANRRERRNPKKKKFK